MSKKRKRKEKVNQIDEYDYFGEFAFIAGYTEGGAPYGITYDEMEEMENEEEDKEKDEFGPVGDDFPFLK